MCPPPPSLNGTSSKCSFLIFCLNSATTSLVFSFCSFLFIFWHLTQSSIFFWFTYHLSLLLESKSRGGDLICLVGSVSTASGPECSVNISQRSKPSWTFTPSARPLPTPPLLSPPAGHHQSQTSHRLPPPPARTRHGSFTGSVLLLPWAQLWQPDTHISSSQCCETSTSHRSLAPVE